VAVVDVRGPLVFELPPLPQLLTMPAFTTYRDLRAAVEAALEGGPRAVVLRIASPGGDVFGSFDCARAIRAAADRAGIPLVAFAEGQAASAAYAIAAACDSIVASDTAVTGSVGVIAASVERSQANERAGLRFSVITSGARKADGHPDVPITPEALNAMQSTVDAMAAVFFEYVSERRGVQAQALEAATFVGAAGIAAGLVDAVSTFDQLVEALNGGELPERAATVASDGVRGSVMAKSKDATRAALLAALEDDSDKEKLKRAKKALAAYDGDDEQSEDEEPAPADEPKEAAAAAEVPKVDEKAAAAEDDKEKPEAAAPAAAQPAAAAVVDTAAIVRETLAAERAQQAEITERAALYAAHTVSASLKAELDKLPIANCKAILGQLPAASNPFTAAPKATLGKGQQEGAKSGDPDLARAFGHREIKPNVKHTTVSSVFSLVGDNK
jgi:signal peptide peptidase SppA